MEARHAGMPKEKPDQIPVDGKQYETSSDAPYNKQVERHLGTPANDRSASRRDEIEKTKQYYHGSSCP